MSAIPVVSIVISIVGLLISLVSLSFGVYQYFKASQAKLNVLSTRTDKLRNLIDSVQPRLNKRDVLTSDYPNKWVSDAEKLYTSIDIRVLNRKIKASCVYGLVPNCCYRYEARSSIEHRTEEINNMIQVGEETLKGIKVKGTIQKCVENIVGAARRKIRSDILEQISKRGGADIICIHGIGGVGKTAVAALIHNQALKEMKDFGKVIWLKVECNWGIGKVQKEIATKLSIDLGDHEANNNEGRASKLRSSLSEKGNILMVFDSVLCHDFCLGDIGISERVDAGACKLIVTSRSYSVCRKITENYETKFFEMKRLSNEDEAWELFKDVAGPDNIKHLGKETHRMTAEAIIHLYRLPKAISLLAEILLNHASSGYRFESAWNEQLLLLSRSSQLLLGVKGLYLAECFKESIETVGENSLQCFTYCALFPKGHVIKATELIDYWMWEGLLGPLSSLKDCRAEGRNVLKKLEHAQLLEIGKEDSIKMLNLVQHVAMHAANNKLVVTCGQSLEDLPVADEWPPYAERASFVQSQLRRLCNNPNSSKLSTLLLQDNLNLSYINDKFFSKIQHLKILDLSHTSISSLPKSLSVLSNLRALLLRSCPNLKCLPSLANLQKLYVVDLSKTPLERTPQYLHKLANLRRLDLSHTRLEVFPSGVVGKLPQLEELLLINDHNGGCMWDSEKFRQKGSRACVEELKTLRTLDVLQLTFRNTGVFHQYVVMTEEQHVPVPRSFKFSVGDSCAGIDVGDNSIIVVGDDDCRKIRLPKGTAELYLVKCNKKIASLKFVGCLQDLSVLDVSGFENLPYLLTLEMVGSLKQLKKISVKRCPKMVSLIKRNAEGNHTTVTLEKLTTLVLYDLPKLESICQPEELICHALSMVVGVWKCEKVKLLKTLPRKVDGVVAIKAEKELLLREEEDQPGLRCVIILCETPVPEELSSTPRIRKQNSSASTSYRGETSSTTMGFLQFLLPLNWMGTDSTAKNRKKQQLTATRTNDEDDVDYYSDSEYTRILDHPNSQDDARSECQILFPHSKPGSSHKRNRTDLD